MVDITLPKPEQPSSTDPHRGFGYVEFELPADAKEAIENMDQSELFGRVIKVAAAKPQKESNEGLGSKTAVWEQVCYYLSILTISLRIFFPLSLSPSPSPIRQKVFFLILLHCLPKLRTRCMFFIIIVLFFFCTKSKSYGDYWQLTFWGIASLSQKSLGGMARKTCYQ